MAVEPEVVFNMDLANAPTSERFCYEAASVLGQEIDEDGRYILASDYDETAHEFVSDVVDEWTRKLDSAGYYVWWNAGDVVVYDLRPLSDEDREAFYGEMENV